MPPVFHDGPPEVVSVGRVAAVLRSTRLASVAEGVAEPPACHGRDFFSLRQVE